MIRIADIQEKLLPLVGWEQSYDPENQISPNLVASESGLYYQGAHPLCTLENIKAIMPESFSKQYKAWDTNTVYTVGNKVNAENKFWIAKADSTGEQPVEGSNFWDPFNPISDYIENETKKGIASMVQTFITMKELDQETRTLVDRRSLFDGAGRIAATIRNTHKLVGFEIVPVRAMGVTTKIERIGLQMTGAIGKVRLHLFHSSLVAPVKTVDVEITSPNGSFVWVPVQDFYLPYIGENNAGGSWFLCYDQNDLPNGMEAINVSKDWSREPCGSCNIGSVQTWREITKYIQVHPFMKDSTGDFADYPELWDIQDNMYTNQVSYGLNLEISVGCDLTDFIISQRGMFATVLQKQVAANILRTLALNPEVRVNRNQSNASKMDILYELDGNTQSPRSGGLGYEISKAYKALSLSTKGLDRICLTCNNPGVKYRTT